MLGLAVRRCVCDKLYAKGRMPRDAPLSTVEAKWRQSEVLGYMCLLAKEVPHEEYKRDPVSMKDQDSLWIISTLNWYYKFSKSIVISFFTLSYYYYFLHNLYETVPDTRHLTLPFQPAALINFMCDQHLVCEDLTTLVT